MVTEEICPTRLLADTPVETDPFGGHGRVAEPVASIGGQEFLTQTRDSTFKVSVFDMWAHQDDPLRRTFLEDLITRIKEFEWVDKERWDRRLDELTKRRSEDTTSVVLRLTGAGLWFALTTRNGG